VPFYPVTDRTRLRGHVRPIIAGASVLVQRMGATDWATVTRTTVDPAGDFAADADDAALEAARRLVEERLNAATKRAYDIVDHPRGRP